MRVPRAHLADASVSRHGATRARGVAALLVLTVILIADTIPTGPLAALRNWVFDAYERHWPRPQSAHQTLIIDIDTESIRDIGQWPWPRDQLARLVEIAAAARVIGIDLLLTEPDRLGGRNDETDAQLAANLRRVPVVLAAAADPEDKLPPQPIHSATPVFEAGGDLRATLPRCRSAAWPYSVLATAASGIGLVTVPPEADGIIRRMPTVESVGPLLIPSFGIEVVRVASRADRISLRTALATAHGIRRTAQIKYCDEDLLARDDRHIGILVIVEVLVLGLRGQCRDRMRHQAQLTRYTPRSRRYWRR